MTQPPGYYDFTVYQGTTFSHILTVHDENDVLVNLTNFTATMQARQEFDSPSAFIHLTTANGGITLGGTAGTITLFMSAVDTAAITAESGYYDLELISSGGIVTRLLQGTLTISKEITR